MKGYLKGLLYCLLILLTKQSKAQKVKYQSPVNHKITLAGSFGELRSSHFHAGIDIKPSGGKTADTIYAVADGFVSRIKTQRGGFGRAVYLDHSDGNTTVYAHLSQLFDPLYSLVFKEQMKLETYEVDIYPEKSAVKIKKGQAIGLMGNAGNSYGAHLHFEVRETQSEIPLNPLAFGIKPRDQIKPVISSMGIHGLNPQWSDVYYTNIGKAYSVTENADLVPEYSIPSWRVGISLQAYDQMNGAPNKNGYYSIKMFVDDTLYFHSAMDRVSYDEGDLIDCYIDYPLKKNTKRTEALLYKLPANTVGTIKYTKGNGSFPIYANKQRNVCIKVADFEGNETSAYFKIVRDTLMIGNRSPIKYDKEIKQNISESFDLGAFSFIFEANTLAKDGGMNVNGYGRSFTVGDETQAVLKSFDYCVNIPTDISKTDEIFFANVSSNKPSVNGGKIENGRYCGKMDAFGEYRFIVDTEAPTISAISFSSKAATKTNFTFKVSDNINYKYPARTFEYKVYIDDVFIPSELKELTGVLTIPIQLLSKGEHKLRIKVSDFSANETEFSKLFVK